MNSSLKKTIHINPELFKIQSSSKSKTKSNREKKSKINDESDRSTIAHMM